jgi:hypothetical protein
MMGRNAKFKFRKGGGTMTLDVVDQIEIVPT